MRIAELVVVFTSHQVFHMLSCPREFGKLGMVCIGSTPNEAKAIYDATVQRLLDACIQRKEDASSSADIM